MPPWEAGNGLGWFAGNRYRWLVLGAVVLCLFLSAGLRSAVGDFLPPWQATFHANLATVSTAAAVALLAYGLCQPLVGTALARFGVRRVLTAGVLLLGVGVWLTSLARSPLAVVLLYGVVTAAGYAAVAQLTAAVAVTQWFQTGRGMALGICTAGNSFGMMLVGPAALLWIGAYGWRRTDVLLALIAVLAVAPLAWAFARDAPGESGQAAARKPPPLREVVRERAFWLLALPYFICGYTTNGLIGTHFVKFLDGDGLTTAVVATVLAVFGAGNIVGSLVAGVLADRWGRARLLAWVFALRSLSLVLLLLTRDPLLVMAIAALYGAIDFATVPPTASLAAEIFGKRGVGTAFAWITLAHQIGAAVSSELGGVLFDLTGSYVTVFLLAAALLVIAVLLSRRLGAEEPPRGTGDAVA